MGCWNKTCGLTRLHITVGTPVYVFPIVENPVKDDRCYSTALFSPLLLPFEAVYNDYGGGENTTGVALPYVMDGIKENLVEMELGENEYHDIAVKKDAFNVDIFFEAVHEGRLKTVDYRGNEQLIDCVMIRKDVVQKITQSQIYEHYIGENKGTDGTNYIRYKYADVVADIPAFLDRIRAQFTEIDAEAKEAYSDDPVKQAGYARRMMSLACRNLGEIVPWEERHTNKVSWYTRHDSYRYSSLVKISETIVGLVMDNEMQKAAELLEVHLLACWIDAFYDTTRNIWVPGCHEGSQAQDHDGYRLLTKVINEVLDEESAYYREMNGEDENEPEVNYDAFERLAVDVKNSCPAINEVTDFAIKQFAHKFVDEANKIQGEAVKEAIAKVWYQCGLDLAGGDISKFIGALDKELGG